MQKQNSSTNGVDVDEINKLKNEIENYERYASNLQYQINTMQQKYFEVGKRRDNL